MLKELRISNIVLIQSATMAFAPGFNVLSGESGAGKSAIMNALSLIGGSRADSSMLRKGADKGVVEAIFDIDQLPHLPALLEAAGIDHEAGCELFIRREMTLNGKSRAFINNQLAQLSLLREVSAQLFEIVSQHANQKLFSLEQHRHIIDMYGELEEARTAFAACWEEEKKSAGELETLIQTEARRALEIDECQKTIEELTEANIKEGEEELLFAEYSRLSNADMLLAKTRDVCQVLHGEKNPALAQLSRQKITLEQLVQLAPELADALTAYGSALLELHEVAHQLRRFESQIEYNPHKAAAINQRLELMAHLKRKYMLSAEQLPAFLAEAQQRLQWLENADTRIEELQGALKALREKSALLSGQLTQKRKEAASRFQKQMSAQLRSLNMPKAEFLVHISPQKRSSWGEDQVEFCLAPNMGEHAIAVKECASGGELSRILLSIQTLLAGKEKIPALIFDEIDGNIGGETAVVVGEKLQEIGLNHQVLCITHFHQVAVQAKHHLRVLKKEVEGRTISLVDLLDETTRQQELSRMLGREGQATTATS